MKYIRFIIGIALLLVCMHSCKHAPLNTDVVIDDNDTINNGGGGGNNGGNNGVPCNPDTVYFENDILPLFISSCAKSGCHDAITHQKGITLNSYANIMGSGEITPFDPSDGKIIKLIQETDPDKIMPPTGNTALTPQQINMVIKWVQQGAKNNYCNNGCDTSKYTFNSDIKPIIDVNCKNCHSGTNPANGIDLSTHSGVQTIALNGKLLNVINHNAGYSPMPKGGTKLGQCEIDKITKWVNSGAPNN